MAWLALQAASAVSNAAMISSPMLLTTVFSFADTTCEISLIQTLIDFAARLSPHMLVDLDAIGDVSEQNRALLGNERHVNGRSSGREESV